MDELNAPAGTDVLIGAPASPVISAEATAALAGAVAATPGILEAHLPQVFARGVSEAPTQALVLVIAPAATPDGVMNSLGPKLSAIIPRDVYLDVWPLAAGHPLLPAVRKAGCRIFGETPRRAPWWKFWA